MMDLKEIIKWFIPCFHILLHNLKELRLTFVCLFLLFNFRVGCAANVKSVDIRNYTKNVDSIYENRFNVSQSDFTGVEMQSRQFPDILNQIQKPFSSDGFSGRTFGRPFKKMVGALIPVIFQVGAASTWAVVAALVGVKTLAVTLLILKILLIAGAAKIIVHKIRIRLHLRSKTLAVVEKTYLDDRRQALEAMHHWYMVHRHVLNGTNAGSTGTTIDTKPAESILAQKIGALFGSKGHGHYPPPPAWEPHPPQKEIHLHIHNGHHDTTHDDHGPPVYGGWNREDGTSVIDPKYTAIEPYSVLGPQTIKTPFGNYVKVQDPPQHPS